MFDCRDVFVLVFFLIVGRRDKMDGVNRIPSTPRSDIFVEHSTCVTELEHCLACLWHAASSRTLARHVACFAWPRHMLPHSCVLASPRAALLGAHVHALPDTKPPSGVVVPGQAVVITMYEGKHMHPISTTSSSCKASSTTSTLPAHEATTPMVQPIARYWCSTSQATSSVGARPWTNRG